MKESIEVVRVREIKGGSGYSSLYIRIPKKVANRLGIKAGDAFQLIVVDPTTIMLKKLVPAKS